jgi:hypothetical protein
VNIGAAGWANKHRITTFDKAELWRLWDDGELGRLV